MRKIFPYLLLNFAVSALAVWVVLMVWEANHKLPETQPGAVSSTGAIQSLPTLTQPPMDAKTVEIQLVVGAGDIRSERVLLVSVSQSPVNLLGWELRSSDKNSFLFPSVTIFPEGEIELYTKGGVNTADELYWNRAEPVYGSGETLQLVDASGNTRTEYNVP